MRRSIRSRRQNPNLGGSGLCKLIEPVAIAPKGENSGSLDKVGFLGLEDVGVPQLQGKAKGVGKRKVTRTCDQKNFIEVSADLSQQRNGKDKITQTAGTEKNGFSRL